MKKAILVGTIILIIVSASQANLISNGGFEQGTPDPARTRYDQVCIVPEGADDITDWEVFSGEVDYFFENYYGFNSSRYIDLHTVNGRLGGIAQSFTSVPGQQYVLEFDVSGIDLSSSGPWVGGKDKYLSITAGDYDDHIIYISSTREQWSGWERRQIIFNAVDVQTQITLYGNNISGDTGNAGMWIDNISVELVPEPTTLLLLGLGAVLLRGRKQ